MRVLAIAAYALAAILLPCAANANIGVSQVVTTTTTSTTSGTANCLYSPATGSGDGLLNLGSAFDISSNQTGSSPAATQIQNEGSGDIDMNGGYVNTVGSAITSGVCAIWTADASGQNIIGFSMDVTGQASGAAFINTKTQGTGANTGYTTSTMTPTTNGTEIVFAGNFHVTTVPSSVSVVASASGPFNLPTLVSSTTASIGKQTFVYAYFQETTAAALTVTVTPTGGAFTGTPVYQMYALAPASYTPPGGSTCFASITPCGGPML